MEDDQSQFKDDCYVVFRNENKDDIQYLFVLFFQFDRLLMVVEFWLGWFDNWGDGYYYMD